MGSIIFNLVDGDISMIMEKLGILHSDWMGYENDDYETIRWTADAKCTKAQWETAKAELQAEYDAQEYARNRASEYPSNGDQWDMIYKDNKNSTTTHADAVEAVKTKWPKDNSGPVE